MESLYKLLYKINENPTVWFGVYRPPLARLGEFIGGYVYRQYEIEGLLPYEYFDSPFREFVAKKYNVPIYQSWSNIINFYSGTDDAAWNMFYKLLDEYLGEKKSLYTE